MTIWHDSPETAREWLAEKTGEGVTICEVMASWAGNPSWAVLELPSSKRAFPLCSPGEIVRVVSRGDWKIHSDGPA